MLSAVQVEPRLGSSVEAARADDSRQRAKAGCLSFPFCCLEGKAAMEKYRAVAAAGHAETYRRLPFMAFGLEDPRDGPSGRRCKQQRSSRTI